VATDKVSLAITMANSVVAPDPLPSGAGWWGGQKLAG